MVLAKSSGGIQKNLVAVPQGAVLPIGQMVSKTQHEMSLHNHLPNGIVFPLIVMARYPDNDFICDSIRQNPYSIELGKVFLFPLVEQV